VSGFIKISAPRKLNILNIFTFSRIQSKIDKHKKFHTNTFITRTVEQREPILIISFQVEEITCRYRISRRFFALKMAFFDPLQDRRSLK
jgi:hypothetical protein